VGYALENLYFLVGKFGVRANGKRIVGTFDKFSMLSAGKNGGRKMEKRG
jgi:hypothetical protein